jgi:hypothetical protein
MAKIPNQAKIAILIVAVAALAVAAGALLRKSRSSSGLSPLTATDKNGDKWVLDLASTPYLPAAGDSIAKIGQPLLIKTDVQIAGRDVSIALILEGQGGETYVPGAQKNGQRLPSPGFRILDEAGKTLAADTFQYG